MSFVKEIIVKDGGEVRLVTASERGKSAWYLLEINPQQYSEYKKRLKTGCLEVCDFGKILKSGWGEPSEKMVKDYT